MSKTTTGWRLCTCGTLFVHISVQSLHDFAREISWKVTGSRGAVFVVRTSKPVENLWRNGLFSSRYSFVTHSIDRKPRDFKARKISVALRATAFGHPSVDVPCASEDIACGYWFSKWRTTRSIWSDKKRRNRLHRPVTRILCGGVLAKRKWTKLPKCIF